MDSSRFPLWVGAILRVSRESMGENVENVNEMCTNINRNQIARNYTPEVLNLSDTASN